MFLNTKIRKIWAYTLFQTLPPFYKYRDFDTRSMLLVCFYQLFLSLMLASYFSLFKDSRIAILGFNLDIVISKSLLSLLKGLSKTFFISYSVPNKSR